ncbi:hypothetical protein CDD82_4054 [Ophiocordyceps australis]|uniref:Nucleolar protein 9 n=1 Tax=Ophiocordyceps australis TaxID=1399860 RepID=A0A2C5Z9B0_9HYPO|nr:hypothetical protein CDD82_4054 [Ophiocordyceps australis]
MPKARARRADIRLERKQKRKREAEENLEAKLKKRQRQDSGESQGLYPQQARGQEENGLGHGGEVEYFGMLTDEEQEYFRRADEMLELNEFASAEDRAVFVESVFCEARGKELKLASSQSCSRLMERLVQLGTRVHKKRLFEAFGGHFASLVRHRFASHCCEALFIHSAPHVTHELAGFAGFVVDTASGDVEAQQPEASMESLVLATLDELEGCLGCMAVDRWASHVLRVLLLVLSGRPLHDAAVGSLVKSRKKEAVRVQGARGSPASERRVVPASFAAAVRKIVADATHAMDPSGVRLLATHPVGNPSLQLLLELDLELAKAHGQHSRLLLLLLPDAPQSLADAESPACLAVNALMYHEIGSRLMETLVAHCPAKVFKALTQHVLLPRAAAYLRNPVSAYPAIKMLVRLGKHQLATVVAQAVDMLPLLVAQGRFHVIKTLLDRCVVRALADDIKTLVRALKLACGPEPVHLVTTLCCLHHEAASHATQKAPPAQPHGAQLLVSMLAIPGPAKGVHEALLALPTNLLLHLATTSTRTASLVSTALATPNTNSVFQKSLANRLIPHVAELASSLHGHLIVNALFDLPSPASDASLPLHIKESLMLQLATHEAQLRDSWMGRSVWRTCRGNLFKTRRADWKAWAKMLAARQHSHVEVVHHHQVPMLRDPQETLGGKEQGNKPKKKKITTNKEIHGSASITSTSTTLQQIRHDNEPQPKTLTPDPMLPAKRKRGEHDKS